MDTPFKLNEAEKESTINGQFQNFMKRPETKMLVSLVPELNPPELLQTLLRAAYEYGIRVGEGIAMVNIVGMLLSKKPPQR